MRADYALYKAKYAGQWHWRARFLWDEQTGSYKTSRNLGVVAEGKRERRRDAEDAAERILKELQNYPSSTFFILYLESFWGDGSKYIEEQEYVNKTPLSKTYIENNRRNIRLHISPCPQFNGLFLSDLSRKVIREYKLWAAKRGMSGRLINQCLQTMRVAVKYAVTNEEIPADPFSGIGKAYHKEKDKGILTVSESGLLITSEITDYYARLTVLLGLMCGMRRGEIRGLRWGDIGDGIITVRHNYVDGDGDKNPKRKGGLIQENTRIVPLPRVIAEILNTVVKIASFTNGDDYIIQSLRRKGVPVSAKYFDHAIKRELSDIGIPIGEQKRRNITLHSLRHSFVTLSRLSGISDMEIQALAGHSARMMERYSHAGQVIDMIATKEKIENSFFSIHPLDKTEKK